MSSNNTYIELIKQLSIESIGNSKYLKWYISIIETALLRKTIEYKEKHHIVPECFYINRKRKGSVGFLSGSGEQKDNYVELTPKEHLVSHLLLIKMFSKSFVKYNSLVFAATKMCRDPYGNRFNSKIYNWVKILDSKIKSNNMKGERNPMFNRSCTYKMTEEEKLKWKTNIGNSLKGVPKSEEHRNKIGFKSGEEYSRKGMDPWNKGKRGVQQKSIEAKMKVSIPIEFRGIKYYSLTEAVNQTGISAFKIKKELFGDGISSLKVLTNM